MRILKYQGKLVEEIGYSEGQRVVYLRYLRDEDKPKCDCGRPIDQEISINEGCPNWKSNVEGVDTLPTNQEKEKQEDDGLSDFVRRINSAVNYKGSDDHEDVRSILKELLQTKLNK